ncbi:MAG: UDP-N-acetylglucosamine 2-epimerase (hydrolyzing) [Muribaculaceae bacterium]|nr:UDP-N-acetylglucosamine 2-epimerase (hydrolyzing) [Muribaculaceae bacterium]
MTNSSPSEQKGMIAIATGTRADWGLLSPLATELCRRGHKVGVMATNMHLRADCGHTVDEIVRDGFAPVAEIPVEGIPVQIAAAATVGFATAFDSLHPRAVVILGDRFEMLGVATAALLCGVPIIHIAGGTVSEGAFDDSIRHSISKMATLHLTETERCRNRLIAMGEQPAQVITTGAIGVENVLKTPLMTRLELETSLDWHITGRLIVATLHAATLSLVSPHQQMQEFLTGLETVMYRYEDIQVLLTYPNNDVDPTPQITLLKEFVSRHGDRVCLVPSLGRVRYMSALHLASAVAGNSSSGLVEVPSVGIPTLDVGIRQAGREHGPSVWHCGPTAVEVAEGLEYVLSDCMQAIATRCENPYARAHTASLMADAIEKFDFRPYPVKKFYETENQ